MDSICNFQFILIRSYTRMPTLPTLCVLGKLVLAFLQYSIVLSLLKYRHFWPLCLFFLSVCFVNRFYVCLHVSFIFTHCSLMFPYSE